MSRVRPEPAGKTGRSNPPSVSPPAGFPAWQAQAAATLERQHGGKLVVPVRVWRQLYIRGLSPAEAAEQADVFAYNVKPRRSLGS